MSKRTIVAVAALVLLFGAGAVTASAQATFKVPFPIKAAGKSLAAGTYAVSRTPDGGLLLRHEGTGKETLVAVLERIAPPSPPPAGPELVFDEVGDFAPSYTEYITVYVLSEAWLPGEAGFRIHVTKGAHKTKTVAGEPARK
jgi:hypothetical protein